MSNQYGKIVKLDSETIADQSFAFDFNDPAAMQNIATLGENTKGMSYHNSILVSDARKIQSVESK